ncbi:unnamed protein product [Thlaspi arvense]|uniref:RNA-binding protein NOB1 n=1 Tax=Thlaspi arvense TaxID=13288 RepID=A0AAU9TAM8_THLAR|nr:unnamed protein product [Thlaspi arvense]
MDPNPTTMWSSIVKKEPPSKPPATDGAPAAILEMVGSCKSTKGISVAVIDTNAVINGCLTNFADKFVTVRKVLSEIRDRVSRRRLALLPFTIETMEPSPESLRKVIEFARATGDLRTLKDTDLELIALTYMLEAQVHGTTNLRDIPPPIQTVRVKRLPEKELPGWGSNVANLEEWEALDRETEGKSNSNSKILLLKDLNMNILPEAKYQEEDEQEGERRQKRYPPKKTELKLEEIQQDQEADKARNLTQDTTDHMSKDANEKYATNDEEFSSILKDMRLEEESLQEETNACITADYAMQNVILEMGLRLVAPGGMQIDQLKRWILQCHACNTVTPENLRVFCPKCGNGGTLCKVEVTIGENGTIIAVRKPRVTLRGTKFSIPMPKSGRDAITKNMVLREDQLPQKYLHPKTKKKASKPGDESFISDDLFMNHHNDRNAPLQPPVREAMTIFSQKRNPNDNHYSRSMH